MAELDAVIVKKSTVQFHAAPFHQLQTHCVLGKYSFGARIERQSHKNYVFKLEKIPYLKDDNLLYFFLFNHSFNFTI